MYECGQRWKKIGWLIVCVDVTYTTQKKQHWIIIIFFIKFIAVVGAKNEILEKERNNILILMIMSATNI